MKNAERRYHPRAELRVDGDAQTPTMLTGYAVVYDTLSEQLGCFREKIAPGAFEESLKTADVRCLIDHNPTLILGRNKAGTLRLFDEPNGLRIECDLPDKLCARELAGDIRIGNVTGMSFGFVPLKDTWFEDEDGNVIRTVVEAEIYDVSAVTYPAYTDTSLALRSLDAWKSSVASDRHRDELRSMRLRLQSLTNR
jgi:HK97 family phage prohead protease